MNTGSWGGFVVLGVVIGCVSACNNAPYDNHETVHP
jgi:hypothetical protein